MIMPTRCTGHRNWNPLEDMRLLERELASFFEPVSRKVETPAVNLWANENEAVVTAEVPGLTPENLSIHVQGRALTLEGERAAHPDTDKGTALREEQVPGKFTRKLNLPFEVENDRIQASMKLGILTVTLPRHARTRPHTIPINAS